MKGAAAVCAILLLLAGCGAADREPSALALVRVLGVDGAGPVELTAVCGGSDQQDGARGATAGESFLEARNALLWSGEKKLSLTGVSCLVIGPDADLRQLLLAALEDVELGAAATVWVAEEGAGNMLGQCRDPASDLELLVRQGIEAPTVAGAIAALYADGRVTLPRLTQQDGRAVSPGGTVWTEEN